MTMTQSPPTGAENVHWNLTQLYPGRGGVEADLSRAEEMALDFQKAYRGRVAQLPAVELAEALRRLEEIQDITEKAMSYAFLAFSTDVADPARGSLLQKAQEAGTQLGTHLLFFNLEWLAVADGDAVSKLADPALDNYRHHLESARRYRPHVLSEPEEKILTEKSVTSRAAWDRLFEEACTAIKVRTGGAELSLDEALAKLHGGTQEDRRKLAGEITDALRVDLRTRRFILNTVLADKMIDDRLRRYPHWIADRNLANEATDESVDALIAAVTGRYDITHRYYALKRRLLGVEKMYDFDRYAPVGGEEPDVTWEEGRDAVLDAYGTFSPRLRELAAEFFERDWIDAALSPNKRGGAYAHPVTPKDHPYVFINWTGKRRDILVLAHELGHGVHMSLSRKQTGLNFQTPLTTAETASIFGETVTFSRLLSQETDPRRRLSLLVGRTDDAIASIFRQIAMNRFEDAVHNHRRTTGELSEDDLEAAWLSTQRAMLGPAVECTENYGAWYSYVPHFIGVPGYVYAYAFGNLLALAIYKRAEEEGPGFAPRYFELLESGGSEVPEKLTARIGVDLADPNFWAGGLEQISSLVDEAEKLSQNL